MPTVAEKLMTAEEFLRLPDDGVPKELVRGEIVAMTMPTPRHGEICFRTAYILQRFLDDNPQGRIVTNDSGVVTKRNPDTVRGADVSYYSFERVPAGPLPQGYLAIAPDVIFEAKSKTDRWKEIHVKVAEYLNAGVLVVCVLDEQTRTAHVFSSDAPPLIVQADEELTFVDVLAGFRVPVRRFFE